MTSERRREQYSLRDLNIINIDTRHPIDVYYQFYIPSVAHFWQRFNNSNTQSKTTDRFYLFFKFIILYYVFYILCAEDLQMYIF